MEENEMWKMRIQQLEEEDEELKKKDRQYKHQA